MQGICTHGLGVQTAEATADHLHEHLRREMGIPENQGKRYSWGYPAIPELEDHKKIFELKIDGAEVCRRIKLDAATRRIPIVMMTPSYIDIYDIGAEGGPEAFVVRPFVREVLANVLERVLVRR